MPDSAVFVLDNDLRDNSRSGLLLADSANTDIERNRIARNAEAGIRIQATQAGNTALSVISNAFSGDDARVADLLAATEAATEEQQRREQRRDPHGRAHPSGR